jgi:hypothetical protein
LRQAAHFVNSKATEQYGQGVYPGMGAKKHAGHKQGN